MKHYKGSPQPSSKNQIVIPREVLVAQMAQTLLYYLNTFGSIIPYKKWKPQDIGYLSEQEFNFAALLALTEYNQYNKEVFKKLTLRKKIK